MVTMNTDGRAMYPVSKGVPGGIVFRVVPLSTSTVLGLRGCSCDVKLLSLPLVGLPRGCAWIFAQNEQTWRLDGRVGHIPQGHTP